MAKADRSSGTAGKHLQGQSVRTERQYPGAVPRPRSALAPARALSKQQCPAGRKQDKNRGRKGNVKHFAVTAREEIACVHSHKGVSLFFFSRHFYLLTFCVLAISWELQAPTVAGYGSSNLGENKALAQYGIPEMQPCLADFLQDHNLDMLEGFNRRDPPWEALQREDFITEPSN